jgi:O-antigen ligase
MKAEKKLAHVFDNILFWALLLATILLFENSFIVPGVDLYSFDFVYFLIISIFAVAFNIRFILSDVMYRLSTFGTIVLIYLIVLFGAHALNVLSFSNSFSHSFLLSSGSIQTIDIPVDTLDRLRSILYMFTNALFIFSVLIALPRRKKAIFYVRQVGYIGVIMGFAFIAYSLITEWTAYVGFVQGDVINMSWKINSAFVHRNQFASFLFFSFIFLLYFFATAKRHGWIYILLSIPFYIVIFFTLSKTNIIISTIAYAGIYFYWLIAKFKAHKALSISTFVFLLAIGAIVLAFRFSAQLKDTTIGLILVKYLPDSMFTGGTIKARYVIWRVSISFIDSLKSLILGKGFFLSKTFLGYALSYEPSAHFAYVLGNFHSGYIETLVTGGLILFIPYMAFIVFMFYVDFRIFRVDKKYGVFAFIALITFLLHSSDEAISLFLFSGEGVLHSIPVILPQLIYYHKYIKKDPVIEFGIGHTSLIAVNDNK